MNRKDLDPLSSPKASFGAQLRRLREARKLSQSGLGELINYSDTHVSAVETALKSPTLKFVQAVDAALDSGGTLEIVWWHLKASALLAGFPEYAEHEAGAAEIKVFELGVIPGLLQTPAYAAADASGYVQRGKITQAQAEERVAFLATRQRLLHRKPPPIFQAVLDESCIRRLVGGPAVMIEQLEHLETLSRQPHVIIQVAPYTLGEQRPFSSHVNLLMLPDGTMLGYEETLQRAFLERDRKTVTELRRDYDRLQVDALSQADSVALIRKVRKELT